MSQTKNDSKGNTIVMENSSEINFRQIFEKTKTSLEFINSHSDINKHSHASNKTLKYALFGDQRHQSLVSLYESYDTRENTPKWASKMIEQFSVTSVTRTFDFLRSLDSYFSATFDLIATRKLDKLHTNSNKKSEFVYKIWRAHLEDSLTKIELVLNTLKKK